MQTVDQKWWAHKVKQGTQVGQEHTAIVNPAITYLGYRDKHKVC